jgi:hypothetical protein
MKIKKKVKEEQQKRKSAYCSFTTHVSVISAPDLVESRLFRLCYSEELNIYSAVLSKVALNILLRV